MKKIILIALFSLMSLYANTIEEADKAYSKMEFKKAFPLYDKACKENNAEACYKVGFMYENKQSVKKDLDKALSMYELACEKGDGRSCYKVAKIYDNSGILKKEENIDLALKFYKKSCEKDFGLACSNLGTLYLYTVDPDNNKNNAINAFKKACKNGVLLGCYTTGKMLEEKDMALSLSWYKLGCDRGDSQACFRLTDLKIKKIAVSEKKNHKKMFKKFKKECTDNKASICYDLGVMYSTGRGTKQNYSKAKAAFAKGCDLGDRANCMEYSMLVELGF